MYITNDVLKKWQTIRTSKFGSRLISEGTEKKEYECPRGHKFTTASPIVIAVDDDPEYNSGPICGYCYVDWFKVNLNAKEYTNE